MNLYLIWQYENDDYDTYDSAVVCAPDESTARGMDPGGENGEPFVFGRPFSTWCSSLEHVNVQRIGKAADGIPLGVVCASFNAG